MLKTVKNTLENITENNLMLNAEIEKAKHISQDGEAVILSEGRTKITVQFDGEDNDEMIVEVHLIENEHIEAEEKDQNNTLAVEEGEEPERTETNKNIVFAKIDGNAVSWNINSLAALYVIADKLDTKPLSDGIKYTREGMQKRVLNERLDRAKKATYKVKLAKNLYGEHTLITEKAKRYKITLRDFKTKTGYINNIDWKTNKLGTTKHIMFLFKYLEDNPGKAKRLTKKYPFIEIYTDPLNDYKISWYFPEKLDADEAAHLDIHFGNCNFIEDSQIASFYSFLHKSIDFERIKIREEVYEKVETYFEKKELQQLEKETTLDYSPIIATLYPYQKEGVAFSVFKKGVIIADEMGLGKTLQSISVAILKKEIFNFKKTLVICPASVKSQWKNEVLKFTKEQALVVDGFPHERAEIYSDDDSFFHIINYERVLRDLAAINKANYDFIILDEAQKIKNYETRTANAVKAIRKKHALVITGTPLENKLLDLYSIVQFLDQKFLTPQWEFSYQHCIFDSVSKNKIRGYYNLQHLKKRMQNILIRREKQEVFDQLPNVIQKNIYVSLSGAQADLHANFSRGIASILNKKFKTTYDWQKLMHLLTNMRMVCDSTYLIDKENHISPKMDELRDILIEKLDIKNSPRKIIIFSEWVTMLKLIGDMLKKEGITFTTLTGKIPVKKRAALIKEFEENSECSVFLSSESGGTGLNLQVADTVINFELPWNPAKKNQRIGRIDRIGQKNQKLYVFNLLSYGSIEMKIATGLLLKQNLFEGVLNTDSLTDEVDFSEKGKSQFLKQLEEVISDDDTINIDDEDSIEAFLENEELQEITKITPIDNKETPKTEKQSQKIASQTKTKSNKPEPDFEQMEEVMTKGMEFLTGIYKMSTGSDLSSNEKPKVNVNRETGEVSISFKVDF